MKVKTAELTGKPLDWALADALDLDPEISRPSHYDGSIAVLALPLPNGYPNHHKCGFFYTDPATCMELIKKHRANVDHTEHAPKIEVSIWYEVDYSDDSDRVTDADFDCQSVIADTLEQAVARCVVAMRLGDEVEVPDELCGVSV